MIEVKKDSANVLEFITCGNYVYYPFGFDVKSEDQILQRLNYFVDSIIYYHYADSTFKEHLLKYHSNQLLLSFDKDTESTISSYICEGVITDRSILLSNDIQIGMSIESFIDNFFDTYPQSWITNKELIIFYSGVVGIKHVYSFVDRCLVQIRFDSVESY
ncbi:MAG TPA: hypothetical protein VMU30_12370 [Bacteroidota bacterium]|nr:hypothetical protein [Bacteroidota bacterium]